MCICRLHGRGRCQFVCIAAAEAAGPRGGSGGRPETRSPARAERLSTPFPPSRVHHTERVGHVGADVFSNLIGMKGSVDYVLKLDCRDQLAQFTSMDGPTMWMRASWFGWVAQYFPVTGVLKAGD